MSSGLDQLLADLDTADETAEDTPLRGAEPKSGRPRSHPVIHHERYCAAIESLIDACRGRDTHWQAEAADALERWVARLSGHRIDSESPPVSAGWFPGPHASGVGSLPHGRSAMGFTLYVPSHGDRRRVPPGHASLAKNGYVTIGMTDLAGILKTPATDPIVVLFDVPTKRLALRAAMKGDPAASHVNFKLNKSGTSRVAMLKSALDRLGLEEWPARVELQRKDDLLILQF